MADLSRELAKLKSKRKGLEQKARMTRDIQKERGKIKKAQLTMFKGTRVGRVLGGIRSSSKKVGEAYLKELKKAQHRPKKRKKEILDFGDII